jgi:replicative DNA helicase
MMGAHEELLLLSKIADTGELRPVLDAGVETDHFHTQDGLAIWKFIVKYYRGNKTTGEVPTRELLEDTFPKVNLPPEDRPSLSAVLKRFQDQHISTELTTLSDEINDYLDKPDVVLDMIGRKYRDLTRLKRTSRDIVVSSSLKEAMARYEQNRDRDGIMGIPYPWPTLNEHTQGMLPGEFVLFYGRPKSMKTWLLLKICCHAYDYASRRVLIYTREMTPQQMMDRSICILIGAPYSAYKNGTLGDIAVPEGGTMEDRFYALMDGMVDDEEVCTLETGHNKSLIITSDREDPKGGGVMGLRQKVEDHGPDLIGADALYLMRNDRAGKRSVKWDDQSAITQDLKDLALDTQKPLVGTTQAKRDSEERKGQSVANISFSDSYGMDCDLAVEILKKKITDEINELALAITGAREINLTGFAINGCAATDFDQMMMLARDEAGVIMLDPETKEPYEVPMVFNDYRDIKDFLKVADKDSGEKPVPKSKAEMGALAADAFSRSRRV